MRRQKNEKKTVNLNESDWQIWGIPLCSKGKSQVLEMVTDWLDLKQKNKWIATVNPEFVMRASTDSKFLKILTTMIKEPYG